MFLQDTTSLFQIPHILHCLQTKVNLLAIGMMSRGFRTCFELNFASLQIHVLINPLELYLQIESLKGN